MKWFERRARDREISREQQDEILKRAEILAEEMDETVTNINQTVLAIEQATFQLQAVRGKKVREGAV